MATLRSKIPVRVESKLKNVSKIPLRAETKPKLTICTEAEQKRTSAVCVGKKKDFINQHRSIKPKNNITVKEPKPINSHLRSKGKENRSQNSAKICQNKVSNYRTPKDIPSKEVAISKPVSQALNDRNKITAKNDDAHPQKKPFESSNHPSQQDIEFVADERMRDLILNNTELTPSVLKSCSKLKTPFVMERPSLYNRPGIDVVDPYKQAFKDIAKYNLKEEGRRISEMHKNRLCKTPFPIERPSLYNRPGIDVVDPYKQAFKDIANYNLKEEGRRISEMHKNRGKSPFQQRNSLYQRCSIFSEDPYKEALRGLAELRMQQKVKSSKKVTFKLSSESQSQKTESRPENCGKKLVNQPQLIDKTSKCSESHISSISSNSHSEVAAHFPSQPKKVIKGSSILLTPELERDSVLSSRSNPSKVVDSPPKANEVFVSRQIRDTCLPKNSEEQETNIFFDKNTKPSTFSSLKSVASNKKTVHEFKNSIHKSVNPLLNPMGTSDVRLSLFSKQSEHVLDKRNSKIFTPQPVSFYLRTKLPESFSPEFLNRRTTDLLSLAPINTPSVLRYLSKQEESPICKKLEFIDSPKETVKSGEKTQTFYLENIMTQQKILDQLAHQECSIFMHESTFPCEIRSNIRNPIAQILNDGDEMHFVPVSLI